MHPWRRLIFVGNARLKNIFSHMAIEPVLVHWADSFYYIISFFFLQGFLAHVREFVHIVRKKKKRIRSQTRFYTQITMQHKKVLTSNKDAVLLHSYVEKVPSLFFNGKRNGD